MTELTQVRRNELSELIIREGRLFTSEQSERYGVSTETIRKDLIYLESIGLVKRTYGGAVIAIDRPERAFKEKATDHPELKRRIARKALELIPTDAVVLLDSGSTVCTLADLARMTDKQLSFYTNSLKAAQSLIDSGMNVMMLGGKLRVSSNAATGAWTIRQISQVRADIAILGATGFDERGAYVESLEESEVKRAMIESADRVILLADASKAGIHSTARFCDWKDIDVLVTDAPIQGNYTETIIA